MRALIHGVAGLPKRANWRSGRASDDSDDGVAGEPIKAYFAISENNISHWPTESVPSPKVENERAIRRSLNSSSLM